MDFQVDRALLEGSQQFKTNLRKMKTIPKVHKFHLFFDTSKAKSDL